MGAQASTLAIATKNKMKAMLEGSPDSFQSKFWDEAVKASEQGAIPRADFIDKVVRIMHSDAQFADEFNNWLANEVISESQKTGTLPIDSEIKDMLKEAATLLLDEYEAELRNIDETKLVKEISKQWDGIGFV